MPFTEPEKRALKGRKQVVEALHQHEFLGVAATCRECGLLPADLLHNWVPVAPSITPISEADGLRFEARNTQQVDIYKHPFDLCESTGNCRECQLPLADDLHDPAVRGSATIRRNVDIVQP